MSFSGAMPFSRARARHGFEDLAGHGARSYDSTRLDRVMSAYGIATTPVSAAIVTSASVAPTSSPVNDLWPSRALARAHAGAAAEEPAEVVRLG